MRMNALVAAAILVCAILPFNNCGAYRTENDAVAGGVGGALCESDLFPTFEETFVPFFNANTCITCHVPGGKAAHAPFAQSDTQAGYRVFITRFGLDLAPDRVYNKLKAGHYGPPFTDLENDLIGFSKEWQQALVQGTCFDYDYVGGKQQLKKGGTIPVFTDQPVDLDSDGIPDTVVTIVNPSEQGYHTIQWQKVMETTTVTFQMEVRVDVNTSNAPKSYTVRNLMIKSSDAPVRVKDFSLLLNDRSYYVTTYSRINFEVAGDDTFHSVGAYSSGIYIKDAGEQYNNDDRWSVKVKTVELSAP